MVGIIISGHGNFASGLQSSLKLISGGFPNVLFVDFLETDSTDQLKQKFLNALDQLKDCNEILALTDLVGGSPFKTFAQLSVEVSQNIKVIGGTNLPMAIDAAMTKDIVDDLESLVSNVLNSGKDNILQFEIIEDTKDNFDDGI